MATNYYNGFDVITVDANGLRVPAAGVTVRINAGAYTAVVTDAFGRIPDGTIASTTDGDVVTFDVSGHTATLNRTLRPTLAATEAETQNAVPTLVLSNAATERIAKAAAITIEDLSNPSVAPQFLGTVQPGTTVEFPYVTPEARNLRGHSNPQYDDGSSKYLNYVFDAPFDLTVDPTTGGGGGGGFGSLDATLAALAALTISANSLIVGTGADAFSDVAFAANTFPGRASAGNLLAKPITDFGFSLVNQVDGPAVRTLIGAGSPTSNFVENEIPSGTTNGSNTTFTLAHTPVTGSLCLFMRGLRMQSGQDYTISGSTITMINVPPTGVNFLCDYRY